MKKKSFKISCILILCAVMILSVLLPFQKAYAFDAALTPIGQENNDTEDSVDIGADERDARVTDEILNGLFNTIWEHTDVIGEIFMKLISGTFEPSLNPLLNLEAGNPVEFGALSSDTLTGEAPGANMSDSSIMSTLWRFAMIIGISAATLILLFNLFLCAFGQAEQIRDTPMGLFIKYCISIALMFLSSSIINAFIDFWGRLWVSAVVNGIIENHSTWHVFMPVSVENGMKVLGITLLVEGAAVSIPGLGSVISLVVFVILIIGIFFAIKLICEFIKLYLEIVERYFILFILLAFFPALSATLVTNQGKGVFFAYLKMLYCQAFLLMVNTIFVKIFLDILSVGGWTMGLLNFLAAFAFLRICQRADAYMNQMGFNVVQTGANVGGALLGAAGGALAALQGLRNLDRGRQNLGNSMQKIGGARNNSDMFKAGGLIKNPISTLAGNIPSVGSNSSFGAMVREHNPNGRGSITNINSSGFKQSSSGRGISPEQAADNNLSNLKDALRQAHVNDSFAQELANQGIQADQIKSIEQLDENGNQFSIKGEDGNLATINGDEVYTSPNAAAMMEEKERRDAPDSEIQEMLDTIDGKNSGENTNSTATDDAEIGDISDADGKSFTSSANEQDNSSAKSMANAEEIAGQGFAESSGQAHRIAETEEGQTSTKEEGGKATFSGETFAGGISSEGKKEVSSASAPSTNATFTTSQLQSSATSGTNAPTSFAASSGNVNTNVGMASQSEHLNMLQKGLAAEGIRATGYTNVTPSMSHKNDTPGINQSVYSFNKAMPNGSEVKVSRAVTVVDPVLNPNIINDKRYSRYKTGNGNVVFYRVEKEGKSNLSKQEGKKKSGNNDNQKKQKKK